MSERAYKMTRLGPGDYLLPSNDAQTLWRLRTYEEDGTATYQTEFTPGKGPSGPEHVLRGTFWAVWRWRDGFPSLDALAASLSEDDWEQWEFWAGPFEKRKAAIGEVLA